MKRIVLTVIITSVVPFAISISGFFIYDNFVCKTLPIDGEIDIGKLVMKSFLMFHIQLGKIQASQTVKSLGCFLHSKTTKNLT